MTTQVETPEQAIDAVVVEIIPTNRLAEIRPDEESLSTINATDAGLAILLAKAEELAAIGAPDKAAYDEVHTVTMVAVKVRTGALAVAKELAAPHGKKYDEIMGEGKRIGIEAKKAEDLLRPIKEDFEEKAKAAKIAEAKAAAEKISARIASLMQLNATYDAGTYFLGDEQIDNIEVQAATDERWQELYALVSAEAEKLASIKREAEALAQAEVARLEAQRVEQEKQQQLLDAQAKQQQEQAQAAQKAIEQQQAELKKLIYDTRLQRVASMGLFVVGDWIQYEDKKLEQVRYLSTATGDEFEALIAEMAGQIAYFKAEAEAAKLEFEEKLKRDQEQLARFRERSTELVALGWVWDDEGDVCHFPSLGNGWNRSLELLHEMDDEAFSSLVESFKQWKEQQAEAAKQADIEAKAKVKADRERTQRLKADKKILSKWSANLASYKLAEVEQPEVQELQNQFIVRLAALAQEFVTEVEAL